MSPDPIRRKGRKTLAKVYDSLSDPEETADRSRIIGLPHQEGGARHPGRIDGGGVGRRQNGVTHTDGQGIHQHRRIILPQAAGHQRGGAADLPGGYCVPAKTHKGAPRHLPRRV